MKKKRKVNKKKLISRVFLLVILIVIIIFIKNIFTKKEVPKYDVSVFVKGENIIETLSYAPYINKDNILYLSIQDIGKIFDKDIYFEEETKKVITTHETKVAAIDVVNNTLELNSANLILNSGVLDYGNNQYMIPISELTKVYNIEVFGTEKSSIIYSLYDEFVTFKTMKKTSLKENTSGFSKTIKKLGKDEELIYIGETEKKGWIKVLSYDGKMGYVKSNKMTDKEYKRTAMGERGKTLKAENIENSIKVTNSLLKAEKLNNFTLRKEVVQKVISEMISKEKYVVNLDLKDVLAEKEKLERFVTELIPRLREIGGTIGITNNNILSSEFLQNHNL